MTQCNTDQLLAPELETYLVKRRDQVSGDLDLMVKIISQPGGDGHENLRHRLDLTVRLAELDTLRQQMEHEEIARRQNDLDAFEAQLESEDVYPCMFTCPDSFWSDTAQASFCSHSSHANKDLAPDGYPEGQGTAPRGLQHENGEL